MITLSIILPTLNEGKNLNILIPSIIEEINNVKILEFEILVIDDGSTDNTKEVINNIKINNNNVELITREGEASLPLSILEGINKAKYEYVMWLDADGSMPAKSVVELLHLQIKNIDSVIIGSRFVEGGGYKGIAKDGDTTFLQSINNIYNSEDSILAVFLSKIFNQILNRVLKLNILDLTSGFIVGKKDYFEDSPFVGSSYGDYFILLLINLKKKNVDCIEMPYFCEIRMYGESKTGSNYIQLIKRGLPYLKLAFKLRK